MNVDPNIVATVLLTVWLDKLLSGVIRLTQWYDKLAERYWNIEERKWKKRRH